MKKRFPVVTFLFLAIVFVGCGDQFLPRSVGKYSIQARQSMNDIMVGSFPGWRPRTKPNQRTEDAVKQTN
jgi:hypothetical protein